VRSIMYCVRVDELNGLTPLMHAVWGRAIQCTKLLLELDADNEAKEYKDHVNTLNVAAVVGDDKTVSPRVKPRSCYQCKRPAQWLPLLNDNTFSVREMQFHAYNKVFGPYTEIIYYSNGEWVCVVGEDSWAPSDVVTCQVQLDYVSICHVYIETLYHSICITFISHFCSSAS